MRIDRYIVFLLITVFLSASYADADVRLPKMVGDNMVLQRGTTIHLWGWADKGERVGVVFGDYSLQTKTGKDGVWSVDLPSMQAGGPYILTVTGKNTVELNNILVGDVWVCSGQSNMEWKVCHARDGLAEVAKAQYPEIRLFDIPNQTAVSPQNDCNAQWEVCRPSTISEFSAIGYFFGRDLYKELNIPIGLINTSWGGSGAETWISREGFELNDTGRSVYSRWKDVVENHADEGMAYYASMGEWIDDVYHAMYAGQSLPQYATAPDTDPKMPIFPEVPTWTYNAMIAPLTSFPITGVIWYQGETNTVRAWEYRKLFPTLITDWRNRWNNPDLPFLFVQLANFKTNMQPAGDSKWAELREAQLKTLELANTGMAVAIDIGESADIHPRNKQEVGRRLMLQALKVAYGRDVVASGPLFESASIRGNEVHIRFTSTGSGLTVRGGGELNGFTIAGNDKRFQWAKAKIDGDEVVVWLEGLTDPKSARYEWADDPVGNLINEDGLPASPFRTDNWETVTQDANR